MHFEKSLGVPRRFKTPHPSFALTRGLMGILRPVVQISMLSMDNAGHHDSLRGGIATKFVGDDHTRRSSRSPQQFAKKPHSSKAIALWLDQNVEKDSILILQPARDSEWFR